MDLLTSFQVSWKRMRISVGRRRESSRVGLECTEAGGELTVLMFQEICIKKGSGVLRISMDAAVMAGER